MKHQAPDIRDQPAYGIVERLDAGETVDDLAEDHDLSREEIQQAVVYSRAA